MHQREPASRSVYRHADLVRLLDPASIAIVGASPRPGSFGQRVAANLSAFQGPVYHVNARYEMIGDARCYPDLAALPQVPDCVVLVTPAAQVEEIVAQAIAQGVGGVVIFASGFAETQDAEAVAMQARLSAMVSGTGTRLIGPNCIGVINHGSGAQMTFSPDLGPIALHDASIGIISQSGAAGMSTAQAIAHGTSVRYTLTLGNACDVDPSDLIAFLADDKDCKAIACIFEGLRDIERFRAAARIAWDAGKPVVIYKMATGKRGSEAALSHTGSMAGSDTAYRALFEQAGVVSVDAIEDLVETASFFAKVPRSAAARGIGVVSTTGGGAVIAADKAEQHDVDLPALRPATEALIASKIPPYGSARNPCDVTGQILNQPDDLRVCANAIFAEPDIAALLLPHSLASDSATWRINDLGTIGAEHGKPLCVAWLPGWLEGPGAREAEQHPNIALFRSMDRCMAALAKWFKRSDRLNRAEVALPAIMPTTRAEAAAAIAGNGHDVIGDSAAMAVLGTYGVPMAEHCLVRSAEELDAAVARIGFPLALKLESPDIPHKTEAGMVTVGIDSLANAQAAFADMTQRAARMEGPAHVNGVLVQKMVPAGLELVIGGVTDPLFGPMVVVGLGGTMVELLDDSVCALAPVGVDEARAMLDRLRGRRLLDGFRGGPAVDLDRLAEIVARVSIVMADHADLIAELDINPLIAGHGGLVAVDALIVRRSHREGSK